MKLSDLRIGARLGLGFSAILLFMLAISWLSVNRLAYLYAKTEEIVEVNNVEASLAVQMRTTIYVRAVAIRNLVLLTSADEMRAESERITAQRTLYREAAEKLGKLFAEEQGTTQAEKDLLEQVVQLDAALAPLRDEVVALGLENKADEARTALFSKVRPVQAKLLDKVEELVRLEDRLNKEAGELSRVSYASARSIILAATALAVVIAAVIAYLATRSIVHPIRKAVAVATTVAGGDLTSDIVVASKDETGQLLAALGDMNASLASLVGGVRAGAETIATASGQIASGNLDLSSRTEQQAGSLEETASSMEELTSTVRHNADNARQASQLAGRAADVAAKGGAVVARVVDTMDDINASSQKIVGIISVIEGIAFQTNILALNAAVEAARAGEQGRGFAVVASEVRNLAQRSASAAKEIKDLIDESVAKISAGSGLVGEAGATMQEVVGSVNRVTEIIGEITAASIEQSQGIEQVNQAIAQMDQVTQQNAALVEEAAAAAGSLEDQSRMLAQSVAAFRIPTGSGASRAGPALAAAPGGARPVAGRAPVLVATRGALGRA